MFLEAQFGSENILPISVPKVTSRTLIPSTQDEEEEDNPDAESERENAEKREIERLHKIGIPVPGVEIRVDKNVAKVWLEDLEVESTSRVLGERVRGVVERAVEVTAPLWA